MVIYVLSVSAKGRWKPLLFSCCGGTSFCFNTKRHYCTTSKCQGKSIKSALGGDVKYVFKRSSRYNTRYKPSTQRHRRFSKRKYDNAGFYVIQPKWPCSPASRVWGTTEISNVFTKSSGIKFKRAAGVFFCQSTIIKS